MLRTWRAVRIAAAASRRAVSTNSKSSNPTTNASKQAIANNNSKSAADAGSVEALPATTPGITRIRKSDGGRVVEVDSTIARIIGSDWGDRRNQTVSLPMRLYWLVFGVVLVNGVYTYLTGKDESYLVEKVQKKVDEKLGVVETNEFVNMATDNRPSRPTPAAAKLTDAPSTTTTAAPASVFGSTTSAAAATMPFFHPSTASHATTAQQPKTKAEVEAQLQQLRLQQQHLRSARRSNVEQDDDDDDVAFQLRLLDQQKAQLKRMLKRL